MNTLCERLGYWLSCWLSCPRPWRVEPEVFDCLQTGDVLLVEGSSRLSTVIQYLTQSSWSHAALFVGQERASRFGGREGDCFVEADLAAGVRLVSFAEFAGYPLRICRPEGLTDDELAAVAEFACQRLGYRYDLRNIFDLARYLMPLPPVPARWRRGMLMLGSGDPTRAICSTLIAEAYQSVRYPILPIKGPCDVLLHPRQSPPQKGPPLLRRRHHSLFTPRDFDLSPYFSVVKPTLVGGFDPHGLRWEGSPLVTVEP